MKIKYNCSCDPKQGSLNISSNLNKQLSKQRKPPLNNTHCTKLLESKILEQIKRLEDSDNYLNLKLNELLENPINKGNIKYEKIPGSIPLRNDRGTFEVSEAVLSNEPITKSQLDQTMSDKNFVTKQYVDEKTATLDELEIMAILTS